jgi:hypothetical protein
MVQSISTYGTNTIMEDQIYSNPLTDKANTNKHGMIQSSVIHEKYFLQSQISDLIFFRFICIYTLKRVKIHTIIKTKTINEHMSGILMYHPSLREKLNHASYHRSKKNIKNIQWSLQLIDWITTSFQNGKPYMSKPMSNWNQLKQSIF